MPSCTTFGVWAFTISTQDASRVHEKALPSIRPTHDAALSKFLPNSHARRREVYPTPSPTGPGTFLSLGPNRRSFSAIPDTAMNPHSFATSLFWGRKVGNPAPRPSLDPQGE